MTDDMLPNFDLPAVRSKKLTAGFDGGHLSSDGGLQLLCEAERKLGIANRLAGAIRDRRDQSRIDHELPELLKTRVFAIACGYEDANDLDRLRHDPLLKLAVGRCPESGDPLCSQSTMSRLENNAVENRGSAFDGGAHGSVLCQLSGQKLRECLSPARYTGEFGEFGEFYRADPWISYPNNAGITSATIARIFIANSLRLSDEER